MKKSVLRRTDLVYPDLSYKIIGALFDVYNEIGSGFREKYYQKAVSVALQKFNLSFKEQIYKPIFYKDKKIGSQYLDFLIENKIISEIKVGDNFVRKNINQVYGYLKIMNLKLGILANFTKTGLRFKRILNIE